MAFFLSYRNTSRSLGEWEMMWEYKFQVSVSTTFLSSPKLSHNNYIKQERPQFQQKEESWKYNGKLWGVWKCDQTLSWVFDVSFQLKLKLRRKRRVYKNLPVHVWMSCLIHRLPCWWIWWLEWIVLLYCPKVWWGLESKHSFLWRSRKCQC